MIDLFIQWLIKQITNTYGNHAFFKDIRKSPHLGIEIVSYRLLQRMARTWMKTILIAVPAIITPQTTTVSDPF